MSGFFFFFFFNIMILNLICGLKWVFVILQIEEQGEEAIDAQAVKEAVVQAIKIWSQSGEQD